MECCVSERLRKQESFNTHDRQKVSESAVDFDNFNWLHHFAKTHHIKGKKGKVVPVLN
jgi:hypothetical protein